MTKVARIVRPGDSFGHSPVRRVLLNDRHSSERDKLRGALRYATECGWNVRVTADDSDARVRPLWEGGWPEGVLQLSTYAGDWRFGGPAVVVDWNCSPRPQLPRAVFLACETVAGHQTLARLLVARGFRRFVWSAFPGGSDPKGTNWPSVRRRLLAEALRAHGMTLETAPTFDAFAPSSHDLRILRLFLRSLGPDTLVLAANDGWGSIVMRHAVEWRLAPTKRFSLLGFDNDRDVCESIAPALSSVDLCFEEAGRTGARLLGAMMDCAPGAPAPGQIVAGPEPVFVERGSTRRTGTPDPSLRVADALAYLRRHALEPITVESFARYLGLTRQRAGALFRTETEKSIARHLADERVRLMQKALRETDLSLADICRRTPFSEESYARTFFRRQTGMSMGEWRSVAASRPPRSTSDTGPAH